MHPPRHFASRLPSPSGSETCPPAEGLAKTIGLAYLQLTSRCEGKRNVHVAVQRLLARRRHSNNFCLSRNASRERRVDVLRLQKI